MPYIFVELDQRLWMNGLRLLLPLILVLFVILTFGLIPDLIFAHVHADSLLGGSS